jgi:hypothetical protein
MLSIFSKPDAARASNELQTREFEARANRIIRWPLSCRLQFALRRHFHTRDYRPQNLFSSVACL